MNTRLLLLCLSCLLLGSGCVVLTKKDGVKLMTLIQGNEENIIKNSTNINSLLGIVATGFKLDLKAGHNHQMSSFYRSTALSEKTQATLKDAQRATERDHATTGWDLGQFALQMVKSAGSMDPTGTTLGIGMLVSMGLNFFQKKQQKKERKRTQEWQVAASEAADAQPEEAQKILKRSERRLS